MLQNVKSHALLIINLDMMIYKYITPTSVTIKLADIEFYALK